MSRLRRVKLSRREQRLAWSSQAKILRAVAEVNEIALDDGLLCGVSGIEAIDREATHLREEAAVKLQPPRLRARATR